MDNHLLLSQILLLAMAINNLPLISPIIPPPPSPSPSTILPPSPRTIPPPCTCPATIPPPSQSPFTSPPSIPPPSQSPFNSLPAAQPPQTPTSTNNPPPPPPSPSSAMELQGKQLNNIIDALVAAGGFAGWAKLLSSADPSTLPITATFFIPGNDALSHLPTGTAASGPINFNPFLIPYHVVPLHLPFSDLRLLKPHTRLPTLLPSNSILITNNSLFNFTINDSPITHPDLYADSSMAVHGIGEILNYGIYGIDRLLSPPPPPHTSVVVPPLLFPNEEDVAGRRSNAACLCIKFPIVFSVLYAAFAFKIYRNALAR